MLFIILLIKSISFTKTSLLSSIIRENLSRYFERSLFANNPFRFRLTPDQSSGYLLAVPLTQTLIANNGLQVRPQEPIINWKTMGSDHLIGESSKPMPHFIDEKKNKENQLFTTNRPKSEINYRKLISNLEQRIPVIKTFSQIKLNNNKNQEINYENIVNGLQKNVLKNISLIIKKSNSEDNNNRTVIDYKNIVNGLQQKELNTIYNQENVFNPKYEYGFKPLETNQNSLHRQIKNYLQFVNDDIGNDNDFNNRLSKKEILNKVHYHNTEYLNTNISEINDNKISTKEIDRSDRKKLTNFSTDKQFVGYKVDIYEESANQLGSNAEEVKEEMRAQNNVFNDYTIDSNKVSEINSNNFQTRYSVFTQFKSNGLKCVKDFGWCEFNHNYPM